MPITPVTAELFDAQYVQSQYPILAARLQANRAEVTQHQEASSGLSAECASNSCKYIVVRYLICTIYYYYLYIQYLYTFIQYIVHTWCPNTDHLILFLPPVCKGLGITGMCCPTAEGMMLGCCDAALLPGSQIGDEWLSMINCDLAGEGNSFFFISFYLLYYLLIYSYYCIIIYFSIIVIFILIIKILLLCLPLCNCSGGSRHRLEPSGEHEWLRRRQFQGQLSLLDRHAHHPRAGIQCECYI